MSGTELDTDPAEEVDSEEEFSRMIQTPMSHKMVANGSTPRGQPPSNILAGLAEDSARGSTKGPSTIPSNNSIPNVSDTPALNKPASANDASIVSDTPANGALHGVRALNGSGAFTETPTAPETATNGFVTTKRDFVRPSLSSQTQPVAPLTASQLDRLMGGLSDDDEINSSSENEVSRVSQSGLNDADITPAEAPSLEVVEETPQRTPEHAFLIVKFGTDPHWWPCRAQQDDRGRSRATVLFRADEIGEVDLSTAHSFQMKPGDRVHDINRPGRFTVERLETVPSREAAILTVRGENVVHVVNSRRKKSAMAVADIYFTDADLRDNGVLPKVSVRSSPKSSPRVPLSDGESTPRRRTRPVFVASPDELDFSSPLRGRSLEGRGGELLPLHDINFDSPPHKRRRRLSSPVFDNCVFTISLNEPTKTQLEALISANGGRVLKEGLGEVISLAGDANADASMPKLVFDPELETASFAAVITDEPRRTMKYLEMVALGWPCLHYKYVLDCLDQSLVVDWLPYTLPAGLSTIPGKLMPVNAQVSAFHSRWLENLSLAEQVRRRRVTIRCSVPFCILTTPRTLSSLVLLAALCAPQLRTWIYTNEAKIPKGALLLDLTRADESKFAVTPPQLLYEMQNCAALAQTSKKNKEWLIQSIISGCIV